MPRITRDRAAQRDLDESGNILPGKALRLPTASSTLSLTPVIDEPHNQSWDGFARNWPRTSAVSMAVTT
jgi:hypothetical protein